MLLDVIALWTGHRASAFRLAYRLTAEGFAQKLGVAVRTVAKWEAAPGIVPTPAVQEALDTALEQAPAPVRARLSLLLDGRDPEQAGPAGAVPHDCGRDIGAMQAFRIADLRVGGGHLYPAVAGYLRDDLAPRLLAVPPAPAGRGMFTAAAALTEMAGWMAHDAGRDDVAGQHFSRAFDLVQVSHDRQVKAHVLASMSHLQDHLRRPKAAIRLSRAGRDALAAGPRSPDLEARLYAMEARGFAALQEPAECARLLACAGKALSGSQGEEPSQWVGGFDEGSLANETARCMRHLGDLAEAGRQASRIIALRPPSRPRSRAFGQLILASVLAAQGEHAEACAVADEVLGATQALGSYVVVQQLLDLTQLLEPHRAAAPVSDFLDRLDAALRERLWLFRCLASDGHASTAAPGVPV